MSIESIKRCELVANPYPLMQFGLGEIQTQLSVDEGWTTYGVVTINLFDSIDSLGT